jgi:hypothetical protein
MQQVWLMEWQPQLLPTRHGVMPLRVPWWSVRMRPMQHTIGERRQLVRTRCCVCYVLGCVVRHGMHLYAHSPVVLGTGIRCFWQGENVTPKHQVSSAVRYWMGVTFPRFLAESGAWQKYCGSCYHLWRSAIAECALQT